jgi:hypothetical protein
MSVSAHMQAVFLKVVQAQVVAMSHGRRVETVRALSVWKAAVRRGLIAAEDEPKSSRCSSGCVRVVI